MAASSAAPNGPTLDVQILSFNDFHGNLEWRSPAPVAGITTGYTETLVDTLPGFQATPTNVDAGGVEFLATHLREARARGTATGITVAAGDLIGASPLLSAAFHDEPTIEAMNKLGLEATSVGNHEFDEGYKELLPCRPAAAFRWRWRDNQNSCAAHASRAPTSSLSANVKFTGTDKTILPPYWIKKIHGVKIGFIGMTLEGTPTSSPSRGSRA